ncbi:MAG: ABC transporter permease [Caldicoprobacterales bacterium]|jgi:spermidine/putrescine transport system permease protein|nr:ABC transporter permease [Clostridiales bacterium]
MMKFLKKAYVYLIFIFLYAPIGILIIYSFNDSRSRGAWGGFTLRWYSELFKDRQIMNALYYTLAIAVIASIVATIVGIAAAIGIFSMKKFKRELMLNINHLPILNPDIVTGIALMLLFASVKLPLGFLSMLLAHITFCIPYVILSIMPKLKQMNKHLYEAALDLGATPFYAFKRVIMPEIMPGVITGFLLALTLSLDDFVISFFTTGNGVTNLSITVESMARRGISPKLNALSTLMFLAVLLLLIVVNIRTSKDADERREKNEKIRQSGVFVSGSRDNI